MLNNWFFKYNGLKLKYNILVEEVKEGMFSKVLENKNIEIENQRLKKLNKTLNKRCKKLRSDLDERNSNKSREKIIKNKRSKEKSIT